MTIVLSEQDWDELWEQGRQTGAIVDYSDDFETYRQGDCPLIGKVHERCMTLQDGLTLCLYDYELVNELSLSAQNQDCSYSVLSFFVAGDARTILHGLTDYVDESAGRTYLSCCADTLESENWAAGQRLLRVQVCFDPCVFFKNFTPGQLEQVPVEVRQAALEKEIQPYYYLGTMTPTMQTVVHQVLNCPYHGLMKRFYLESKALELITLQFCQLQENDCASKVMATLKADDIERIHQAKDILIAQLDHPPSLLELARQVAINDHKLKQGFRQVFGTTVFGYLHHYRLEKARQLLDISELRVAEVAHQVGFADRSYFAAAFRKKFGLNPGSYRQQHRKISVHIGHKTPPSLQRNSV